MKYIIVLIAEIIINQKKIKQSKIINSIKDY